MKINSLLFFLATLSVSLYSQNPEIQKDTTALVPEFFFAIIVSDIEVSMDWYERTLGFEEINFRALDERGFKQANLHNGRVNLELIELVAAVNPARAIPDFNDRTKLLGLFKVGYTIDDFDQFLEDLAVVDSDALGAVVLDPLRDRRMLILKDPDGNRVQIFEGK